MRIGFEFALGILVVATLGFLIGRRFFRTSTVDDLEPFVDQPQIPYLQPAAEIRHSDRIGERGVFATRDYKPGDLIEVCPALKQTHELVDGQMSNYIFTYDNTFSLIGFGYCSMYNHADDNNAEWEVVNEKQIKVVAIQPIVKGQEIFVSYGDDYWAGKKKK